VTHLVALPRGTLPWAAAHPQQLQRDPPEIITAEQGQQTGSRQEDSRAEGASFPVSFLPSMSLMEQRG